MTQAWTRQKALQERKIPDMVKVTNFILRIKELRTQALFALTYLTAGRASEVVAIKRDDLRKAKKAGKNILLITMINKKNQRVRSKRIPVRIDLNPELCSIVFTYISGLEASSKRNIWGFNTTRRMRQLFDDYGFNPHWIRHLRLTHLVTHYDVSDFLLQRWAGWSSTLPAKHYLELRWTDLLRAYPD